MENSQKSGGGKDIKQAYREAYLIGGFLKQTLTQEEKEELDEWILASEKNMILFEKMTDEKNLALFNEWIKKMSVEKDFQKTKRRIEARKPIRFWQYAAAAVVIVIIIGVYLYRGAGNKNDKPFAVQTQDIMPGSDKATLTLDNGKIIELGNDGADTTINDQVKILRKDGKLIYSSATPTNEIVYHTLNIPRKGQY